MVSCAPQGAEPIKLNTDGCEFCKMKIADGKFGAEIITAKGRIYKFDDMHCIIELPQRKQYDPNFNLFHSRLQPRQYTYCCRIGILCKRRRNKQPNAREYYCRSNC